jgi:hypothetical protein
MSSNVVINSSHWDKSQSKFIYRLKIPQKYESMQVGLASISIYNQFFNVSQAYGNNQITIIWINLVSFTYTIPDGYYNVSDLNYFLQNKMISDKLYMTSTAPGASSSYLFFVEFIIDANRYAVQLNVYTVPSSATADTKQWAKPDGSSWILLTNNTTPQITFNDSFGKLIGYTGATYPSSIGFTDIQYNSNLTPEISKVTSLILNTNLINNINISPSNCLNSIPVKNSFGDQMDYSGGFVLYSDIQSNYFNQIEISISDQTNNTISLIDTDCTIILSIKNK